MADSPSFREVGDRIWVARFAAYDVNVGVIGGARGLVVVDTLASTALAREIVAGVRGLGGPVVEVVNTHWHFDHSFGNHLLRQEYAAPVTAHEDAAAELARRGEEVRAHAAVEGGTAIAETPLAVPDRTFSSALALDLGDRQVELIHPGRGHTAGDLVVRVPDADVLLAGDLVEESGPPAYGDDSFPMDWPLSLDLVLGLLSPGSVVVPGHGAPVGRDFVLEQRSAIGVVAETIRDLAGRGVPVAEAPAAAEWPFPAERLGEAVRRGYEQLPRANRRLPLV